MTIPKITPYSGGVANPDGSQTQTEFTQNMFDQLSYEAELSTELNNTVDGINDTATQVDSDSTSAAQSAAAAEAAVSGLNYQGLWPDSGGIADKGDTYQTQVSGTPTGQYFTALQNTTVDPVGDDANWRAVVSFSSISGDNLISNASFEIAGSVTNPPDATARDYVAGDELFNGVFALGALTGVTYVNGMLNGTGQLYTDVSKSEKQKLVAVGYVTSIAESSGLPNESGASFVDNGDYWRVTFDMTNTFSVKLEQGSVATVHEVGDEPKKIELTPTGNPVFVNDDGSVNLDKSGVVPGSDAGPLITDIINSGISKKYISTFNIEISTITFNTNNTIVKFYGDVSITGDGAVMNAARCELMAFGKYRGTECEVVDGVLVPTPTVASGVVMNGALNGVFIPEAYGFVRGIVHPAETSGFECTYGGHLTKCLTAVQLESVTGGAIHEGNTWNLQIFQCNNGYIVENGGNRYQRFLKVVDNVQITNGKDIVDNQGSHQIRFYFYRRTASEFNGEANVNDNLVGEARIGVESSEEFSRISSDSVTLKADDARTDMRTSSSVNDFDFREKLESGGEKQFLAKGSQPYIRALPVAYGLGAMAFYQIQGAFGADWSGFTPPTTNTNGQRVEVYNTDFPGSDNERLRVYVKSPAGWHYFHAAGLQ